MTFEIGLLIGILVVAVILFIFDWVSPDVVALGLVLALVFTGLVPVEDAFAGFGSDTVIMILGLFLLTAALWRTGVVDWTGGILFRLTGTSFNRVLVVIMLASATLGAFVSNTASTAFFIPVVLGIARRARVDPSQLLLPLAFSSILTSSVTLISTSTNIIVSGLMTRYRMAPMGLFELAPVGIPVTIVGLAYMYFVARHWLPRRHSLETRLGEFGIRPYLSEVVILRNSPLAGKTLEQSGFGRDLDLAVLRVLRNKDKYHACFPDTRLEAGDVLLVEGQSEEILKIKDTTGVEIKADVKLSDPNLSEEELGLVEGVVLPRSPLVGRTLKGLRFRERYGLQVLGVNRHGETLREKISLIPLRIGDMLLLQGAREKLSGLEEDNVRIISTLAEKRPLRRRAPVAVFIFVAALGVASFNLVPLHVAVLAGAVLTFLTGCITSDAAYREVEWKVIILIGCMLAVGVAMEQTGTARYLASLIVHWCGKLGPVSLLSGFFVLTVIMAQAMSHQAAAIIILPIAIRTALQLNLNPRTFAMMIAVAASCSYMTPLEPACLMVYGPGRYRFRDFLRIGAILTILIYLVSIFLVPRIWPLQPPRQNQITGLELPVCVTRPAI